MTSIDTEQFERRLLEERERLLKSARYLHQENPGSMEDELGEISGGGAGDNHLADMATVTYDRELDQGLEEGVQQTLEQIDAALARIQDGTFGLCETCGKPIAPERLQAIPWTTRCIDDAKR
ncbi:MAG TPA: TraR/DksA C4-type zinc finger protein [Gaiellaceae bacterium]|jgi:RNA polymerase-binding protein DksA